MDVSMLLRCCISTLLLLVAGCAQCHNVTYGDCVKSWCEFHSVEDGQKYTTRLTVKTTVTEYNGPEPGFVTGFKSHTANAEGTVVSTVDVEFSSNLNMRYYGRIELQEQAAWITKSPFVKDFWLGDWPGVNRLSVHMYNMSLNQTYVSNMGKGYLRELELTGSNWPTTSDMTLELTYLRKLSLSGNLIEELQEGLLKGCFSLEVIDLSRNKIRSYSNLLISLRPLILHLKELNLAENIMKEFYSTFAYSSWQINKINASYNQIRSVHLYAIPRNSEVDFSFNNITEFSDSPYSFRVDRMLLAGQNISSLSELGTILSKFDREMFEYSIPNVQVVYDPLLPKYRPIFSLYVAMGECTLDRKFMYCNANDSNILPTPESTFINLTGNALKMDRLSGFEIWPENLVDLSENNLMDLKDVPREISDTKQLNLSRNSIGYITRHLFENMTRLTVIDLSYNQLKHVQLILYSSLFMLDISNNYLNRINISHNSSKFITEYLNLSHNSFTNILKAEWSQLDHVSKIDLGENNFECCSPEGRYSRTIFLHYQNKILNINSTKALTCVRPHYGRVEMTSTWLSEDHCEVNVEGWAAFGCLLFLMPLLIHAAELLDYYLHQTERDLAEQLTHARKQGLEQDEKYAPECEYDAFVCHSHKDARWVRWELVPNLENDRDGHRLCIHYRDFQLGSFIEENVEKAMNTSRKVIVVVTRSFLQSNWCKMELTFAWNKMVQEGRNYIIVIELDRLPKDKRPPILSYLMRSRTYLEWPEEPTDDDKQVCWSRVRDALGKSLRDRQQEQSESGTASFQIDC